MFRKNNRPNLTTYLLYLPQQILTLGLVRTGSVKFIPNHFLLMVVLGVLTGCASTSDWKADPIDPNNTNIEKAIRKELNKPSGNLTTSDLHKIRELSLGRYQLTTVSALKQLNQLEWLDLYENRITDVTALGQLNKLKYLDLHGNQIKDLSPLRKLKQL